MRNLVKLPICSILLFIFIFGTIIHVKASDNNEDRAPVQNSETNCLRIMNTISNLPQGENAYNTVSMFVNKLARIVSGEMGQRNSSTYSFEWPERYSVMAARIERQSSSEHFNTNSIRLSEVLANILPQQSTNPSSHFDRFQSWNRIIPQDLMIADYLDRILRTPNNPMAQMANLITDIVYNPQRVTDQRKQQVLNYYLHYMNEYVLPTMFLQNGTFNPASCLYSPQEMFLRGMYRGRCGDEPPVPTGVGLQRPILFWQDQLAPYWRPTDIDMQEGFRTAPLGIEYIVPDYTHRNNQARVCYRDPQIIDTIVLHHTESPFGRRPNQINENQINNRPQQISNSTSRPQEPWYMIGYNYLIDGEYIGQERENTIDPIIYQGRPLNMVGAHAGGSLPISTATTSLLPRTGNIGLYCIRDGVITESNFSSEFTTPNRINGNVTSIGIAVIGNYQNRAIPTDRILRRIAQLSCSLQKSNPRITRLVTHNQISDRDTSCPGNLQNYINRIVEYSRSYGCHFLTAP